MCVINVNNNNNNIYNYIYTMSPNKDGNLVTIFNLFTRKAIPDRHEPAQYRNEPPPYINEPPP